MARRVIVTAVFGFGMAAAVGCGKGGDNQPNPNLEIPKTDVPADVKPPPVRGGLPGVGGKKDAKPADAPKG